MCISMGCGAGKVTPAESLQSQRHGGTAEIRNDQDTEEVDAPGTIPDQKQPPKLYRRPQQNLRPSRTPIIDPFTSDNVESSAADREIPHKPMSTINNSSPLSLPHPQTVAMFHPAAPFIAGSLNKKHREASSSQIDFFKMLDKKIEEGPEYEEN